MNTKRATEILARFPEHSILVIGDIFVDHYVHGVVERLNPEAPVPILEARRDSFMTGGAGNVAKNVASLGAHTTLLSVVGKDTSAEQLHVCAKEEQYDANLIQDSHRSTIRKIRYFVGSQQLLRVDYEKIENISADLEQTLLTKVDESITSGISGILISDYAKGVITESVARGIIERAKKKNIPVAADVKPSRAPFVTDATFISPNIKEAHEFLGLNWHNDRRSPQELAQLLTDKMSCNIFLTLGADGMYICSQNSKGRHIPQRHTPEVFDPSGAGDTAIVVLLLATLSGASSEEAAELANAAGAVVVSKIGSVGVTPKEIELMLKSV